MNDTTKNILWAVVAVVFAVVITLVIVDSKSQVVGAITSPGTQLDYVNITQGIGFGPNSQTIGALSTNIMGVRSVVPTAPSFVVCSMANPFNATSTLINASLNITTGTSSAASLIFSVASSATATTTAIGSAQGVASGALATLQSSGVASTTDLGVAVGPNQFVNIGTTAGSAVGYAYQFAGTCNALFQSAN